MVRKTLTAAQTAERLADLPVERPEIALVVLFGSTVRNRVRRASDIDIAVRCNGPADLDALYVAIVTRLRADPIDLVDLARAGPLLAFEIARSGQLLFERRLGAFNEFQSLASSSSLAHDPERKLPATLAGSKCPSKGWRSPHEAFEQKQAARQARPTFFPSSRVHIPGGC